MFCGFYLLRGGRKCRYNQHLAGVRNKNRSPDRIRIKPWCVYLNP